MSNWLLHLPVLWMGVIVLGGIYLATAGLHRGIAVLAVGERARIFKAISPSVLAPLATIYALLFGFLAAQVWSDADRANTAVNHEASALRSVVLLTAVFPGESESRIDGLLRSYIQETATNEWPEMARGHLSLTLTPPRLSEALRTTLALTPSNEGQTIAQREMVASLESVLDARRQRIILSKSSINWVKWTVLLVQAGLLLVCVAMVHSDDPAASRIILTVFATGIGAAVVLIASHSRPFTGDISVSPSVLLQVLPDVGPSSKSP
jgi:hypothetical protein